MTGSSKVAIPLNTIRTLSVSASFSSGVIPPFGLKGSEPHPAQAQTSHGQANQQAHKVQCFLGQPLVIKL